MLVMEQIQVMRRMYECLYVHVFSSSSMSIVHYVMGLLFYSLFGLCMLSAVDYRHLAINTGNRLLTSGHIINIYLFNNKLNKYVC